MSAFASNELDDVGTGRGLEVRQKGVHQSLQLRSRVAIEGSVNHKVDARRVAHGLTRGEGIRGDLRMIVPDEVPRTLAIGVRNHHSMRTVRDTELTTVLGGRGACEGLRVDCLRVGEQGSNPDC